MLPSFRQKELEKFVRQLGLSDLARVDWELLDLALTHATVSSDRNNEQLEFVGDGVLRLAIARFLWDNYRHVSVGEFTAIRSVLASDRVLADIADSYGLDRFLMVGSSTAKEKAGYRSRLADGLEAIIAALYLSTESLDLVRPWIEPRFAKIATETLSDPARLNYKAALQEWTQGHYKTLPEYRVCERNTEYNSSDRFSASVWLRDRCLGEGTGRSIKAAEQAAARSAFLSFAESENASQD